MEKRRKKQLLGLCAGMVILLCALSGCWHPATRGELIDWFQENYTDAPLMVSGEAVEEDEAGTVSYEAYLKDAPELVFHLQSKRVYVGEHSEYRNVTDFDQVYGAHYFAQYQERHPVQFWRPNDEYAFYNFPLGALYDTPAELDAAAEELLDIHRFLAAPNTWTFSFAQLYRLLSALGWETLEGSETDFTFLGVDGCTYALSYVLWEDEDGNLVNRCTKDGVPMDTDEGCFSSYSLLTDMTGIVLQEESNVTYRGPDDDGITHFPQNPACAQSVSRACPTPCPGSGSRGETFSVIHPPI